MFILIALPFVTVATAVAYLVYVRVLRPSPTALGSVIPKVRVVSADEISEYCDNIDQSQTHILWRHRKTRWRQFVVAQRYLAQMSWNTKLFQQMLRFEELKIDPTKSSLFYETRETLSLRLAEDAAKTRWLLIKAQIVLFARVFCSVEIRTYAVSKLQHSIREYKALEMDTVALVEMAKDKCYHAMLVERLGLSDWGLIEGGTPA